jgi:processive 1,2-diacylglycerol beta-glucosyltransferase
LDTFRPLTAKVTKTIYLQTLTLKPALWGKWYESQRGKEWTHLSRSLVAGVLRKNAGRWLQRLAPDAVICTHPLPVCLMAELKRKGFRIPLCTVLTDYDLHGYWTHSGVDLYCMPTNELANELRIRISNQAKILVTGIPISQSFLQKSACELQPDAGGGKHILIMGGGLGIGVLPIVQELVGTDHLNRFTVVCGRNQVLFEELKERYRDCPNIRIIGFTDRMHELMAESDLLVTKAGGLTISEALAMRLPMVLYIPSQGQEWRNGKLMVDRGAAVSGRTPSEVAGQVQSLLQNSLKRSNLARQIEYLRRPEAAWNVAEAVIQFVEGGGLDEGGTVYGHVRASS